MRDRASNKLIIVSPAPARSTFGNSVTADRYARIFRSLGWHVEIRSTYEHEPAQCLVGLHAAKSASSILAFRNEQPKKRIVVVLTGTDLYRDIHRSARAGKAMRAADALVTLQPAGIRELPRALQGKAVAIIQSAQPVRRRMAAEARAPFTICVLGHLRYEKDPMRAAYAVRQLPKALHVRLIQAGQILDERYARATARESERNARYEFSGALSRAAASSLLARSDLLVQSSRMEGGANAVCEAIAAGVPILASRIPGNIGILGKQYPGLYPVGDTAALAALLERAATSTAYYIELQVACQALKPLVSEQRERDLWEGVLDRK
ncbi:MAG: hypothetical protein NVSMB31_09900 [Vulcanimicrobiaceae bacterium]